MIPVVFADFFIEVFLFVHFLWIVCCISLNSYSFFLGPYFSIKSSVSRMHWNFCKIDSLYNWLKVSFELFLRKSRWNGGSKRFHKYIHRGGGEPSEQKPFWGREGRQKIVITLCVLAYYVRSFPYDGTVESWMLCNFAVCRESWVKKGTTVYCAEGNLFSASMPKGVDHSRKVC